MSRPGLTAFVLLAVVMAVAALWPREDDSFSWGEYRFLTGAIQSRGIRVDDPLAVVLYLEMVPEGRPEAKTRLAKQLREHQRELLKVERQWQNNVISLDEALREVARIDSEWRSANRVILAQFGIDVKNPDRNASREQRWIARYFNMFDQATVDPGEYVVWFYDDLFGVGNRALAVNYGLLTYAQAEALMRLEHASESERASIWEEVKDLFPAYAKPPSDEKTFSRPKFQALLEQALKDQEFGYSGYMYALAYAQASKTEFSGIGDNALTPDVTLPVLRAWAFEKAKSLPIPHSDGGYIYVNALEEPLVTIDHELFGRRSFQLWLRSQFEGSGYNQRYPSLSVLERAGRWVDDQLPDAAKTPAREFLIGIIVGYDENALYARTKEYYPALFALIEEHRIRHDAFQALVERQIREAGLDLPVGNPFLREAMTPSIENLLKGRTRGLR